MKLHERIWLRQLEPTGCFYICVQNNLICFLFFVFICCDVFFYHWCGVGRRVLFWQGGGLVCQRLSAVVNADFGGVQVLLEGKASTLTPNCLGSTIPVLTGDGLLLCSNVQHYHFVVQKNVHAPLSSPPLIVTPYKRPDWLHTLFSGTALWSKASLSFKNYYKVEVTVKWSTIQMVVCGANNWDKTVHTTYIFLWTIFRSRGPIERCEVQQ